MKILVIGGSYFLGKAFVNKAKDLHELTVFNRGNRPLNLSGVEEVIGDRTVHDSLLPLAGRSFDAVVDFCAYSKGDIESVYKALSGQFKQYIFISTCDIYQRGLGRMLDETAPLEIRDFGGEAGAYIMGKVDLEQELLLCANKYANAWTSIRPAFIYGPDNYAPRESIYFTWISQAGQIIHPQDANGEFQMTYVEDVALAIHNAIANEKAYNQAYNLAPTTMENYDSFADALSVVFKGAFEKVAVDVQTVNEKGIPLPFPLTKEESNYYDGSKALDLIGHYTTLAEGLKKTAPMSYQDYIDEIERLFDENKAKEAEGFMLRALNKARVENNMAFELQMLNELIGYYRQTSEKDKLVEIMTASIAVADKMGLMSSQDGKVAYATTALNVANGYRSIADLENSKKYYAVVQSIYDETLDSHDMLLAGFYNNMSLFYQEHGDIKEAMDYQLKALDIVSFNEAGFETAVTYANLANTAFLLGNKTGDYSKSEEYAKEAIRRFEERNLYDAHYCAAVSALGLCLFNKKEYEQARDLFQKGMNIVENSLGQNSQYLRLKENRDMCISAIASLQ